jgi:hypothetical protein
VAIMPPSLITFVVISCQHPPAIGLEREFEVDSLLMLFAVLAGAGSWRVPMEHFQGI